MPHINTALDMITGNYMNSATKLCTPAMRERVQTAIDQIAVLVNQADALAAKRQTASADSMAALNRDGASLEQSLTLAGQSFDQLLQNLAQERVNAINKAAIIDQKPLRGVDSQQIALDGQLQNNIARVIANAIAALRGSSALVPAGKPTGQAVAPIAPIAPLTPPSIADIDTMNTSEAEKWLESYGLLMMSNER